METSIQSSTIFLWILNVKRNKESFFKGDTGKLIMLLAKFGNDSKFVGSGNKAKLFLDTYNKKF